MHFYHLHALDWVDIVSALSADPGRTSTLAQSISDWPLSSAKYFAGVRDRVKGFVDRGQLGPFANAYWGHPAYRLPPEANLMAVAHYLEALDWQREFIKLHAVLGGKNPHLQSFLVGGMATPVDPNSQSALERRDDCPVETARREGARLRHARVHSGPAGDRLLLQGLGRPWTRRGQLPRVRRVPRERRGQTDAVPAAGHHPRARHLESGALRPDQSRGVHHALLVQHTRAAMTSRSIRSRVKRLPTTRAPPPYERLDTDKKYSWLKSPRYGDEPMEVGPLARMLVAYVSGHARVKALVDAVLQKLGVGPEALFSTLGRVAARGIETQVLAEKMDDWVDALAANMASGELRIHDNSKWEPSTWPADSTGSGLHEAPRGALSHWVHIQKGLIANYQCVVPSTWNAGPRDAKGRRGPYEDALIGTPVANPQQPIEILRTVHSFDPCMACGVHVLDATRRELARVRVV